MFYEVIHSEWFYPTIGISLAGYYTWVILIFFKAGLTKRFREISSGDVFRKPKVQVTWDDLAMAFEVHRRLIANPHSPLDEEERTLLGKSPFKELIQQTTIH